METTASAVFRKLQLGQRRQFWLRGEPPAFAAALAELDGVQVLRDPLASADRRGLDFVLAFVSTSEEVAAIAAEAATLAADDPVLWLAYPKAGSKRHRGAINRDTGWAALGEAGFEPVRQVAIDADWSALRFRRVQHIRRLTRDPSRALSAEGRRRSSQR
jgi:hypothetical protein